MIKNLIKLNCLITIILTLHTIWFRLLVFGHLNGSTTRKITKLQRLVGQRLRLCFQRKCATSMPWWSRTISSTLEITSPKTHAGSSTERRRLLSAAVLAFLQNLWNNGATNSRATMANGNRKSHAARNLKLECFPQ